MKSKALIYSAYSMLACAMTLPHILHAQILPVPPEPEEPDTRNPVEIFDARVRNYEQEKKFQKQQMQIFQAAERRLEILRRETEADMKTKADMEAARNAPRFMGWKIMNPLETWRKARADAAAKKAADAARAAELEAKRKADAELAKKLAENAAMREAMKKWEERRTLEEVRQQRDAEAAAAEKSRELIEQGLRRMEELKNKK